MPVLIQPQTERLKLRQWQVTDREPFAALNADPEVMEFFPATLNRPESDAIADKCEALQILPGSELVESDKIGCRHAFPRTRCSKARGEYVSPLKKWKRCFYVASTPGRNYPAPPRAEMNLRRRQLSGSALDGLDSPELHKIE